MNIATTFLWIFLGLAMCNGANAAMYRCTDAAGKTSFSDKPCPTGNQELLKERHYSPPKKEPPANSTLQKSGAPGIAPIKPLAGGRKVSRSSPLAKAYRSVLGVFERCDRAELKEFTSKNKKENTQPFDIDSVSESDLIEHCEQFGMIFPQPDFKDATEVIDGNHGSIQWLTVENREDGNDATTMRAEQTLKFVKQNGEWQLR
jgi:hypothetical protein